MSATNRGIVPISGTDLWLVPVTVARWVSRAQSIQFPGLDPFVCDPDQDEHALVRATPGEPLYCYRCRVSSEDANPHLAALVRRGDADLLGVPPYGCLDTDAVAQQLSEPAPHQPARPRRGARECDGDGTPSTQRRG